MSLLSVNSLVGANLAEARGLRRLTQQQLGERLEDVTGKRWSKATISALERSADGERVRQFDADDIAAMARVLDVPIMFFFLPSPRSGPYVTRPVADGEVAARDQVDFQELVSIVLGDDDHDPSGAAGSWISDRIEAAGGPDAVARDADLSARRMTVAQLHMIVERQAALLDALNARLTALETQVGQPPTPEPNTTAETHTGGTSLTVA